MDVEYLKNNGFNIDMSLEIIDDINLYNEILNDFILDNKIEKLIKYKRNNDVKKYIIQVHNIKSECLYLGIEKLAKLAEEHQINAEENNIKYIENNFEILLNELERIIEIGKIYLSK